MSKAAVKEFISSLLDYDFDDFDYDDEDLAFDARMAFKCFGIELLFMFTDEIDNNFYYNNYSWLYIISTVEPVAIFTDLEEFTPKSLFDYMSDSEKRKWEKDRCFLEQPQYIIYKLEDVQTAFDRYLGAGRVDVGSFRKIDFVNKTSSYQTHSDIIITDTDYVYFSNPIYYHESRYPLAEYEIINIEIVDENRAVVKLIAVQESYDCLYDFSSGFIYPYYDTDYYDRYIETEKKPENLDTYKEVLEFEFNASFQICEIEVFMENGHVCLQGRSRTNAIVPFQVTTLDANSTTVKQNGGTPIKLGPGNDYDDIAIIPDKTEIFVQGRMSGNSDWLFVDYYEDRGLIYGGWVIAKSLSFVDGFSVIEEAPYYFYDESYTVNAKGGLRLRKGPGTNYDAVLTIPNNSTVQVIGSTLPYCLWFNDKSTWAVVEYDNGKKNLYGWVSTEYLEETNYDDFD
jgi:uncharacterized protein YraI